MGYDIIRAHRKVCKVNAFWVFVEDVLFCAVSAILCFIHLLIFTNGVVRGFVIFAALAGFIFCRLTLSRIFFFVVCKIFKLISFVLAKIRAVFRSLGRFLKKIMSIFKKILKNSLIKAKKLLKSIAPMLYTKMDNDSKESES